VRFFLSPDRDRPATKAIRRHIYGESAVFVTARRAGSIVRRTWCGGTETNPHGTTRRAGRVLRAGGNRSGGSKRATLFGPAPKLFGPELRKFLFRIGTPWHF